MKTDKPATSGEAQRCPTCGSDERDMPLVGTMSGAFGWLNDAEHGTQTCPDTWHAAPVSPAPPQRAVTLARRQG